MGADTACELCRDFGCGSSISHDTVSADRAVWGIVGPGAVERSVPFTGVSPFPCPAPHTMKGNVQTALGSEAPVHGPGKDMHPTQRTQSGISTYSPVCAPNLTVQSKSVTADLPKGHFRRSPCQGFSLHQYTTGAEAKQMWGQGPSCSPFV